VRSIRRDAASVNQASTKEWEATVTERHFPVSGQWVRAVEHAVKDGSDRPFHAVLTHEKTEGGAY